MSPFAPVSGVSALNTSFTVCPAASAETAVSAAAVPSGVLPSAAYAVESSITAARTPLIIRFFTENIPFLLFWSCGALTLP